MAIGCDHGGFELKEEILKLLKKNVNITVIDFGASGRDSVDYPDFGRKVAEAVDDQEDDLGGRLYGELSGQGLPVHDFSL